MNNKKLRIMLLSLLLAVQAPLSALALQPSMTTFAATGDAQTYQSYQAGTAATATAQTNQAGVETSNEAKPNQTETATKDETNTYQTIEITTEQELAELAENCKLDNWSKDKMVQLKNDIVLKEYKELVIPTFGGRWEGNGYQISGLYITDAGSVQGLFRYLQESAVIQNLTVEGSVRPDGSRSQVGGIVGANYGKIYNCHFRGTVKGDSQVGGIAGVNEKSGEIRNCSSSAKVMGNHSTGGIAGSNHGVLNYCNNKGTVNTSSEDVSYNLEDITMEKLEDINSTENVSAHTDTGGIAGLSDGKIYYCSNEGTIGYQHVGYNVGGIVGRLHQGYLQSCTNRGNVLGRKDVGGVVGQMEPFLEVIYLSDKLQELDSETEYFLDLLDATQSNMRQYGSQASQLVKSISASLKTANAAGGELLSIGNETWYVFNQEFSGISNDIKILNQDMEAVIGSDSGNGSGGGDSVSRGDISVSGGNLDDYLGWGDSGDTESMESYRAALRKFSQNTSAHLDKMTNEVNENQEEVSDNLDILNRELDAAGTNLAKLSDTLIEASDTTGSDVDALVEQAKVLRRLINEIRDDLFRYEGITVENTSDETSSDEISCGNTSSGETSSENEQSLSEDWEVYQSVYYDTDSFQQGKVTYCVNKGVIEADTNVGGIVGQVATEYDLDPEEDITYTGAESFDIERTVKAIVRDSQNFGTVRAKKDCAGGIVGKSDFGATISCESYSEVSSTSGSFVGGIAGSAGYAIRSCYSMGMISGKNNIGGIVGMGCDVFDSYAYNQIEATGEWAGAIAGNLESDGMLSGNYYVAGAMDGMDNVGYLGGVDNVGYLGGATPVSYEGFCNQSGIPEAFRSFTVTFVADGRELASYQCRYGDALTEEQIPTIPEKDGYYGVWPEFDFDWITGNAVLEARYEKWITSIAGAQTDETGKPMLLAEGEFLPGTVLVTLEAPWLTQNVSEALSEQPIVGLSPEQSGDRRSNTISFRILSPDGTEYKAPVQVRVLCPDTDKVQVEVMQAANQTANQTENQLKNQPENNACEPVETHVMGSYLVFEMDSPGTFRIIYPEEAWYKTKAVMAVGCAGLGIVILAVVMRIAFSKRKKQKN